MIYHNKRELKAVIDDRLSSLLLPKCYVLDAPFHENAGDILIWGGKIEFLSNKNIEVKGVYSYNKFRFNINIDSDTFICIHGGGNFNDLYPEHLDFLQRVVDTYPHTRIIVFPQTIYFKDSIIAKARFERLKQHDNLYICGRDGRSYQLLKKYFVEERSLLVPDMAFYIPDSQLQKYSKPDKKGRLLIERVDVEATAKNGIFVRDGFDEVSDWPSFQHSFTKASFVAKVLNNLYQKLPFASFRTILNVIWNAYYPIHCRLMTKEGVRFISPYSIIYTTRLHGAILSILLSKDVVIYDNSYGKNYEFYQTWLKDFPNVSFVSNK